MISSSLDGVGPYSAFRIHFWKDPGDQLGVLAPGGFGGQRFARVRREFARFNEVISVHHEPFMGWSVHVHSVQNKLRAQVRQAVTSRGIPLLRARLTPEHPATWLEGHRVLQVGVDAAVSTICAIESLGAHIESAEILEVEKATGS